MKPSRKVDHERLRARLGGEHRLAVVCARSIRKVRDAYLQAAKAKQSTDGEIDRLMNYASNMLFEFNTLLCNTDNPARFLQLVAAELEGKLRCGGKYHDVTLEAFNKVFPKVNANGGLSVDPVRPSEVFEAVKEILHERWDRDGKSYSLPSKRTVKRELKSEGILLSEKPGKTKFL